MNTRKPSAAQPAALKTAIRHALLCLSLGLTVLPHAQAAEDKAVQLDIAAGSLDAVLSQFSRSSGLNIAFDRADLAGKNSPGLHGSYSTAEALARLLSGSGLQAVPLSGGGYRLIERSNNESALALEATTISGTGPTPVAITEGSGSYTTASTNGATGLDLSLRETPQSVSVITRQQMDDRGVQNIGDVLRNTPGVSVQAFDSNRMVYSARGFAISNYKYDGVSTIIDNIYEGAPHGDTAAYDHVEVVKGSTGLLAGSGDPSATVNLVRKKPTQDLKASIAGSASSWDSYRTEGDISGPLNASGTLRGRFVGTYQDSKSYLDHYQQKKDMLYGILEADLTPDTLLTLGIERHTTTPRGVSWTGNPVYFSDGSRTDFPRSHNPGADWSRRDFESSTYFAALEQALAHGWKLKLNLNHQVTDHDTRLASASGGNPDPASGDGMFLYWGRWEGHRVQNTVDASLSGPFTLFGREHELLAGAMASHSRLTGDTFDGSAFSLVPGSIYDWNGKLAKQDFPKNGDYETTQSQNGLYLATRLRPSDDLALILGTRVSTFKYDNDEDYFAGASLDDVHTSYKEHGAVTPYAGVVYDLDGTYSAYASYTSIYQPQTNKDSNGSTLAPTEGNSYEAGLKAAYLDGRLNATLAVFRIEQDNVAENIGTNPVTNEGIYRAIDGATTKGVELELSGELQAGWNLSAGYTYARTRDADQQRIFGFPLATTMPEHVLRLFTSYRLPGALEAFTVGGGLNWQSAFYGNIYSPTANDYTRIKQSSYTLASLMANYRHSEHLSLTLNANNLFDKKYLTGLGNFDTTYYGEPRNLALAAKWTF